MTTDFRGCPSCNDIMENFAGSTKKKVLFYFKADTGVFKGAWSRLTHAHF